MKLASLLLLISIKLFGQTTLPEQIFSVQQLKEDFKFMRNKMEKHNTNLYLYTDKKTLDSKFEELYNGIDKPMSAPAFFIMADSQNGLKNGWQKRYC